MALCLDGLIRERTADRRSLDDFMHALWRRFGTPERAGYLVADLDALVAELTDNAPGVVSQLVTTNTPINVRNIERFGFDVATKGYAARTLFNLLRTATLRPTNASSSLAPPRQN